MPQSLSQVILHIVLSTQKRPPWLDPEIRPRLQAYLATVCREEEYRELLNKDHVEFDERYGWD